MMVSFRELISCKESLIQVSLPSQSLDITTYSSRRSSQKHNIYNGIIEFDSSRLEMGAVADLFDRHGEGLIDWKEFIAALRPDWEERRTYQDTDKIHDEVKRLVMLCTCRQKFRVFQVGEGKYRV